MCLRGQGVTGLTARSIGVGQSHREPFAGAFAGARELSCRASCHISPSMKHGAEEGVIFVSVRLVCQYIVSSLGACSPPSADSGS